MRTLIYCLVFMVMCPFVHSVDKDKLLDGRDSLQESKSPSQSSGLSEQNIWLYHPEDPTSGVGIKGTLEIVKRIGKDSAVIVIETKNYVYNKSLPWQPVLEKIMGYDMVVANAFAAIYRGTPATIGFLETLSGPSSESFDSLIKKSQGKVGNWHSYSLPIAWSAREPDSDSQSERLTSLLTASSLSGTEAYRLTQLLAGPPSPVPSSPITPPSSPEPFSPSVLSSPKSPQSPSFPPAPLLGTEEEDGSDDEDDNNGDVASKLLASPLSPTSIIVLGDGDEEEEEEASAPSSSTVSPSPPLSQPSGGKPVASKNRGFLRWPWSFS